MIYNYSMINNSVHRFYNNLFPFRYFVRKMRLWKQVYFGRGSKSINSIFEGRNAVFANTCVSNCFIGLGTYINSDTHLFCTKIGRFCSIADHVRTGFGTHPTNTFVSTFPSFYYDTKNIPFSFMKNKAPLYSIWRYVDDKKRYVVEIGNDVWIGSHVLIMDGVKIGDGAVIAAGAVVTKDVEPYSIVGGVPAKHIKYRFNKEQISSLLKMKWWNKDWEWIKNNYASFSNINSFLK